MPYSAVFILFGSACLYIAAKSLLLWVALLLLNIGISFFGVGIAYGCTSPGIFMKRTNGTFPLASYAIFWPYFLVNYLSLHIYNILSSEQQYDEILSGLYLGRKPSWFDKKRIERLDIRCVLDLTAEFEEVEFFRCKKIYSIIPLLDTSAPTFEQLKEGVNLISKNIKSGPIYVHCALGHGRSTTFIAAYLLESSYKKNIHEVLSFIQKIRPKIGLTKSQLTVLGQYEKHVNSRK